MGFELQAYILHFLWIPSTKKLIAAWQNIFLDLSLNKNLIAILSSRGSFPFSLFFFFFNSFFLAVFLTTFLPLRAFFDNRTVPQISQILESPEKVNWKSQGCSWIVSAAVFSLLLVNIFSVPAGPTTQCHCCRQCPGCECTPQPRRLLVSIRFTLLSHCELASSIQSQLSKFAMCTDPVLTLNHDTNYGIVINL